MSSNELEYLKTKGELDCLLKVGLDCIAGPSYQPEGSKYGGGSARHLRTYKTLSGKYINIVYPCSLEWETAKVEYPCMPEYGGAYGQELI